MWEIDKTKVNLTLEECVTESTWFFLGGGNMATAIIRGFVGQIPGARVHVIEPRQEAREELAELGCSVSANIDELSDLERVVVAVKPQVFPTVVDSLANKMKPGGLVVSIMVGVDSTAIAKALPGTRIVRVMPNTPMMVGKGMSGIALCEGATENDYVSVSGLFGASGGVLQVPEAKIDDVAAISGSGPAYFFRFCEILVQQAVDVCGFDQADAERLVAHTAEGSIAYLMSQEGFPAATLRKQVTSPGGTTQAALESFSKSDWSGLIEKGLMAAKQRAAELQRIANEGKGD